MTQDTISFAPVKVPHAWVEGPSADAAQRGTKTGSLRTLQLEDDTKLSLLSVPSKPVDLASPKHLQSGAALARRRPQTAGRGIPAPPGPAAGILSPSARRLHAEAIATNQDQETVAEHLHNLLCTVDPEHTQYVRVPMLAELDPLSLAWAVLLLTEVSQGKVELSNQQVPGGLTDIIAVLDAAFEGAVQKMRASGEFKPAAIRYDFRPGVMAPKERVALLRRLYGNGTGGANPNGRPQTSGGNRPQSPTKRKAESVVASYITGPRRFWPIPRLKVSTECQCDPWEPDSAAAAAAATAAAVTGASQADIEAALAEAARRHEAELQAALLAAAEKAQLDQQAAVAATTAAALAEAEGAHKAALVAAAAEAEAPLQAGMDAGAAALLAEAAARHKAAMDAAEAEAEARLAAAVAAAIAEAEARHKAGRDAGTAAALADVEAREKAAVTAALAEAEARHRLALDATAAEGDARQQAAVAAALADAELQHKAALDAAVAAALADAEAKQQAAATAAAAQYQADIDAAVAAALAEADAKRQAALDADAAAAEARQKAETDAAAAAALAEAAARHQADLAAAVAAAVAEAEARFHADALEREEKANAEQTSSQPVTTSVDCQTEEAAPEQPEPAVAASSQPAAVSNPEAAHAYISAMQQASAALSAAADWSLLPAAAGAASCEAADTAAPAAGAAASTAAAQDLCAAAQSHGTRLLAVVDGCQLRPAAVQPPAHPQTHTSQPASQNTAEGPGLTADALQRQLDQLGSSLLQLLPGSMLNGEAVLSGRWAEEVAKLADITADSAGGDGQQTSGPLCSLAPLISLVAQLGGSAVQLSSESSAACLRVDTTPAASTAQPADTWRVLRPLTVACEHTRHVLQCLQSVGSIAQGSHDLLTEHFAPPYYLRHRAFTEAGKPADDTDSPTSTKQDGSKEPSNVAGTASTAGAAGDAKQLSAAGPQPAQHADTAAATSQPLAEAMGDPLGELTADSTPKQSLLLLSGFCEQTRQLHGDIGPVLPELLAASQRLGVAAVSQQQATDSAVTDTQAQAAGAVSQAVRAVLSQQQALSGVLLAAMQRCAHASSGPHAVHAAAALAHMGSVVASIESMQQSSTSSEGCEGAAVSHDATSEAKELSSWALQPAIQAYAFLNTVLWRVWAAGMAQQWSLAQQASAQDADNAQTLKEAQTALLLTHIANLQESLQAKASTPELVPMQQEVAGERTLEQTEIELLRTLCENLEAQIITLREAQVTELKSGKSARKNRIAFKTQADASVQTEVPPVVEEGCCGC